MPGAAEPREGRPLVGDVVGGKYRLDSIAGEGAMGIVYQAEHVILRQRVALKAMLPGSLPSSEALERFSLEASVIARITCEHVVRVMDAGTLPSGAPYLVIEYLDGEDLAAMLARRGPLPPEEVVDFALQALEALAHAHAGHVVHRDLKCANLFCARTPDGRQIIKLLDFGLVLTPDLERLEGVLGEEGRIVGSPLYMSPEQLRRAPLDPRTDLWSLGVVIYELIAGTAPFDGPLAELLRAILTAPHVPLRERRPEIVAGLSDVVDRCLVKDPAKRWASTAELARALAPYGTDAWRGAVGRIERALAGAAPWTEPRHFETEDAALHALDAKPRPPIVTMKDAYGATIPAPRAVGSETLLDVATSVAPPTPALGAPLRILMIDDSEFVLGVHSLVLEEAGFEVHGTTSSTEFDELLASWPPHLVLMDVEMPGVSVDDLCRRVRTRFGSSVPVVLVSQLGEVELGERAKRAGADAHLSKSGDWPAFVDFVRNICAITYSPEHLP